MSSETELQQQIRLHLARQGSPVLRNNSGASKDMNGRLIRFGLGNDSAKINKNFKSADLIGIRPVMITPEMVGKVMGQFLAVEVKHPGWKFPKPTNKAEFARCNAQKNFLDWVNRHGGYGVFAQDVADVGI